jgi:hypothetical protein
MVDFKIECKYELNPLLRDILGARLLAIFCQKGSFGISTPMTLSSVSSIIVSAFEEKSAFRHDIQFDSKGYDSYAGNLYGIEISKLKVEYNSREPVFEQLGYHFSIHSNFGLISKVVGLGEIREETVFVEGKEDEVIDFFPPSSSMPTTITINKKTLEVIGLHSDNGKWLYFFADREGYFRTEFETEMPPEEMCRRWDFVAMEKNLQILEVFE